jgi:hypothetical protein
MTIAGLQGTWAQLGLNDPNAWRLFTNVLWLSGLAIVLAALSHADWLASSRGRGLKVALRQVVHMPSLYAGLAMACLGATLSVALWWQRTLWCILTGWLILGFLAAARSNGDDSTPSRRL